MQGRFWFLVHNLVAHPLLCLLSFSRPSLLVAIRFHKWTGTRAVQPDINNPDEVYLVGALRRLWTWRPADPRVANEILLAVVLVGTMAALWGWL